MVRHNVHTVHPWGSGPHLCVNSGRSHCRILGGHVASENLRKDERNKPAAPVAAFKVTLVLTISYLDSDFSLSASISTSPVPCGQTLMPEGASGAGYCYQDLLSQDSASLSVGPLTQEDQSAQKEAKTSISRGSGCILWEDCVQWIYHFGSWLRTCAQRRQAPNHTIWLVGESKMLCAVERL